jgi:hypothetical protein
MAQSSPLPTALTEQKASVSAAIPVAPTDAQKKAEADKTDQRKKSYSFVFARKEPAGLPFFHCWAG